MTEDVRRLPPHDEDVERAVLGAMMIAPLTAVDLVRQALPDTDEDAFWYHHPHAVLCRALLTLRDEDTPIDLITVTDHLKRMDALEGVGGISYLSRLFSEQVTAANVSTHLAILREYYVRRRMIERTAGWSERSYGLDTPPLELVAEAGSDLQTLLALCQPTKAFTSMDEGLGEHIEYMEQLSERGTEVTGTPTGLHDLDQVLAGLHPGDSIVLAARPSVGKTALGLNLSRNAAMAGHGVLFFSLEMARSQLMTRLICMECLIPSMRVRRGRLNTEEWTLITEHSNDMARWPIYFNDQSGMTIAQVRAMARSKQRELATAGQALGLIVVDYLQLVQGGFKSPNREQEVAHISRELKALAKETAVPVVALSQLSRNVEHRPDKRPQLADLRDSGEIEQNADVVLFLYRPSLYGIKGADGESLEGIAQVIVAKHRNGPLGTVTLQFDPSIGLFQYNPPEQQQEALY